MNRPTISTCTLAIVVGVAAIVGGGNPPSFAVAHKTVAPAVPANVVRLVDANSAFAFSLAKQVGRHTTGNLLVSPASISNVLAMTYAGARGTTAQQLASALHFDPDAQSTAAAFAGLDQLLAASPPQSARTGAPLQLEDTEQLWAQAGLPLTPSFLGTMTIDFHAPVGAVDYAHDPATARATINAAVANATHGRIEDLLGPGVDDATTRLALVNTVYFKGSWYDPFYDTKQPIAFRRANGSTAQAPAMVLTDEFDDVHTPTYDAVQIPYIGGATMQLIVPAPGQLAAVQAGLDNRFLTSLRKSEKQTGVTLTVPRFSFRTEIDLVPVLEALGVHQAFAPPSDGEGADFTGIDGQRDLSIGAVVHQTTITVDKNGTEASASTAAVGKFGAAAILHPKVFTVDRPFLLVIQDSQTHSVLFIGRVTDPTEH